MPPTSDLRQPTRREPLRPVFANQTEILGVIGLRCRLLMYLNAQTIPPIPISFVVDSGASYSMMSLDLALSSDIPVPPPEAEIALPFQIATGSTTIRVRPGRIRGWWDESLCGYPFDWPVLFTIGTSPTVPSILGLGGIVKTCQWTFDGRYVIESPSGYLTLEDTR